MSRLLHAAARGARIEGSYKEFDIWNSVSAVRFDNFYDYRIHPADEHLQYGPISTALRVFGMGGDDPYTLSSLLALDAYLHEKLHPFTDSLEQSLFLLILAEAMADSGL
jgi:hypothetical protein